MQFVPYLELRDREKAAGHDQPLASCFNLAGKEEIEDGQAIYLGQGDDIGDRCVLFIDRNGWATLVLSNGTVVRSDFDLEEGYSLLASISWMVAL